jgi:hypothetical protein
VLIVVVPLIEVKVPLVEVVGTTELCVVVGVVVPLELVVVVV